MPESAPGRAPAGAGGRAKGAYQDRDKPAQIRFSNIAAGKGAAAAGGAGPGPAWAAIGAGGDGSPGLAPPGPCRGLRAGIAWVRGPGAARDADTSPRRAAFCSFVSAQT